MANQEKKDYKTQIKNISFRLGEGCKKEMVDLPCRTCGCRNNSRCGLALQASGVGVS